MNKKRLFIFKQALALFMVLCSVWGWGQLTLTGTNYSQNFDGVATGLPTGWLVRNGVTASADGTGQTFSTTKIAWSDSGNSFKNLASADGLEPTASTTVQSNSLDRVIGVKQGSSGAAKDVAFELTVENTTGFRNFNLLFKLQSLVAANPRVATWFVQYKIGSGNWTTLDTVPSTLTTGGKFSNDNVTVDFGNVLDNKSSNIKIRIYTVTASGSGNGAVTGIDDFLLNWENIPTCTTPVYKFDQEVVVKTTNDAPFTNLFTSNDNTSPKVFSSSNTNVATVNSATGEVTIVGVGSTTISVTQAADATYCAVSASYTLNVTSAAPSLAISGTANHGPVCIGTPASVQTYTVTNTGNSAAAGLSVSSDNPQFVVSNISSTTVNGVNGTVTFDVTFTPAAAGAQNASLTVTSTTSGSNTATYQITGTGNPTVAPAVAVGNADVTNDAATLHGNVTSLGSCLASPIVNRGFVYTVFSSPEINGGTYVNEGTSATGAFSVNITGLVPAKIYFYKAFVVDAAGNYYYSPTEGTFTTSLATPVATAATNVTPVGFTANWNAVNGAESYELDVYEKVENISPNLVVNPGFENSTLDPWTFETGMNQVISNSPVKTGTASLYSTVTATRNFNQDIALENGKEYKLKFSYYIDPSSTGNGFRVWTTTGATVQLPSSSAYYNTKGSWIDVEHIFTASGSNLTLNLRLYNGVKIYFDDFDLRKSESILTNNYILNATNVGNVTSYEVTGLNPESTYYYVVRAVSGAVTSANSNEIEVTTQGSPTWNGTTWSNNNEGPDATTPAIIDGDYSEGEFTALSLTVNAGKTLTVNNYVSVGNVTNNGNILVADGANFVQTGTFTAGAGSSFKVRKDTKPVKRLAYINWSSPMAGSSQTLKQFSYGKNPDGSNQSATGTVDNRFFTYNNNTFESIPPTTTFQAGAGYQIRTPNDFTTTPQVFHGQFEGTTPNTGAISIPHNGIITGDYVLLGNPYPSAISISDFLTHNPGTQGTFYIWNSGAEMIDNSYGGGNYNTYAPNTGSVPAGSINGYIPVGQGFFIERGAAIAPFVFTNAMRQTTEDGVFSKAATADKFWLELTAPSGSKPQMLIGFNAAATAGYDAGFDAALFGTNADALYSEVNGTKLVIDAHGTFSSDDTFALKADLSAAGNYTIGILKSEGVFANGQQIWLKDQLTGTTTLISEQPYAFSADAGTLANRFVLQFKPGGALATDSAVKSDINIYSAGSEVHAKSSENITSLNVYDMSGRMIAKAPAAQKEIVLNVAYKGVVLVKAQLANGTVKTTKLMLK